ncbi:MAG: glucose-phosphate thymidylyltransferase [Bacteroidetes bacterium]|jgi:UDP-N-acetylglucosamine diphosphorylase/glucosamine-1-phosphate N-acetyltransferase|nr:glucose-phosphate thymidylyltransferase [Bacteroidota bacterium]
MSNFILFDDHSRTDLLPFTYLRPVSGIRIGILTITEKWEKLLKTSVSFQTEEYLGKKFGCVYQAGKSNIWINGKVCPTPALVKEILSLKENEVLLHNKTVVAVNTGKSKSFHPERSNPGFSFKESAQTPIVIKFIWDIFTKNGEAIKEDFELQTKGRTSQPLSKSNRVIGKGKVFLEKGASVEGVIFNTTKGNVYIGKDAVVMEGSLIRGPFALCEHAEVKMGAKIYGPTTFGPHCKIGGEVNNSVIFGYSNKAHDGFLGNSVISEWCNLGADTNNSNLKNNYGNVKLWNYGMQEMVDTGLQFCGLFMGDHSKCGINTMFNTGTVVGVNANIYGADFPIHFIRSFSWGGAEEFVDYKLDKALEVAEKVMARRSIPFTKTEKDILSHVYDLAKQKRVKETY